MQFDDGIQLIEWFRVVYGEVLRLKQQVLTDLPVTVLGEPESAERAKPPQHRASHSVVDALISSDPDVAALLAVQDRLTRVIEQQAVRAQHTWSSYSMEQFRKAQYVMTVLADEVFLFLEWRGAALWPDRLLEMRLFHTAEAGERFFDLVEDLLRERDAATTPLAKVCLLALSLGFKGRYRADETGPRALDAYREGLYDFIARYDESLDADRQVLFPAAYDPTMADGRVEMLPAPSRWIWIFVGLFATLLLTSLLVWGGLTAELNVVLDGLLEA